jgi:F0F1-type ATP synthase assembly protein I
MPKGILLEAAAVVIVTALLFAFASPQVAIPAVIAGLAGMVVRPLARAYWNGLKND